MYFKHNGKHITFIAFLWHPSSSRHSERQTRHHINTRSHKYKPKVSRLYRCRIYLREIHTPTIGVHLVTYNSSKHSLKKSGCVLANMILVAKLFCLFIYCCSFATTWYSPCTHWLWSLIMLGMPFLPTTMPLITLLVTTYIHREAEIGVYELMGGCNTFVLYFLNISAAVIFGKPISKYTYPLIRKHLSCYNSYIYSLVFVGKKTLYTKFQLTYPAQDSAVYKQLLKLKYTHYHPHDRYLYSLQ